MTTSWSCKMRCPRCAHEWVGHFASTTRYEKKGPFGGWERRGSGH